MRTRTVFGLALAVALPACTSSSGNGVDGGGEGGQDAIVATPCPSSAPLEGSACSGAASCPYGTACDQTVSVCTGGFWENSPAVIGDGGECPVSPPAEGADCTVCPSTGPCTYNASCELDGGTTRTASCKGGRWSVTSKACPFDAGTTDAGAPDAPDVTADAPSDAPDGGVGDAGDAGDASADH